MNKRGRSLWRSWYVGTAIVILPVIVGLILWFLVKDQNIAILNPQGVIANQQKDLILFTLLLSAVVVVPVFIMLAAFAWRYREGNHKAAYTPDVEGNRWLETIWWGIPIVIIGILSVVTWVTTHQLDPYKPIASNVPPLKVQVVALQWKWLFIYPEQKIATVNELMIPAGTPISAFWIPSLGSQTYAMTGMSSKLSLMADGPGTFYGTNSNINGKGYADMNFKAIAVKPRDFNMWVKAFNDLPKHDHIDLTSYKKIVKPSTDNPVAYYHLHSEHLYTEIINQYMHGGHAQGASEYHSHEHEEGKGN